MKRTQRTLVFVTLLALMLASTGTVLAAKKVKAYTSQITHTFTNIEATPAQGLTIILSSKVVVETDKESGQAGPFRNVTGNDGAKLVLTNPTEPIAQSAAVDLVFQSYDSKIVVKSWWWTNAKGKRIGKKQKG